MAAVKVFSIGSFINLLLGRGIARQMSAALALRWPSRGLRWGGHFFLRRQRGSYFHNQFYPVIIALSEKPDNSWYVELFLKNITFC